MTVTKSSPSKSQLTLPTEIWVQIAALMPHTDPANAWYKYRHVPHTFRSTIEDHYVKDFCPLIQERKQSTPRIERTADLQLTRKLKLQSYHGALLAERNSPAKGKRKRPSSHFPDYEELLIKRRRQKLPTVDRLIFGSDNPRRRRP